MEGHPKCPECGLYFHEENSLQEHFRNYHSKISCEKCKANVLETEIEKHREAHNTMKNFKTGLEMGKVRAKSTSDPSKPKRGMTAFNLFSKEVRPKIRSENPSSTPQEMFKFIGEAWKEADKEFWERAAKEQNNKKDKDVIAGNSAVSCPFCNRRYNDAESFKQHMVDTHQAKSTSTGSLNAVPSPTQGKIYKCRECGKLVTSEKDLNSHMEQVHIREVLLLENPLDNDTPTTLAIQVPEEESNKEPSEEIPPQELEKEGDPAFEVSQIVFVKKKTIHWRGKVTLVTSNQMTIKMFGSNTLLVKKKSYFSDIKPFEKNE